MNNTLPDDIEQLKALLIAQQAVIVRLSGEITGYAREISSLRALVAKLQRMLFGRSSEKSREKIEKKIARAETRITELQNRPGEAQLQLTSMAGETAPKTSDSPVRKALPATLPRDRQVISPAETECPVCSGKLKPLGERISEQLDIINTAFKVIETVRPELACSRCDCIVQAPQPPKPIERSYASPALLARIIMAKFAEHLPLYRQSEIYARQGVELHRNTMGRWVDIMGEQLRPLYDEVKHYVLMPGKVHADDTPVNVLEPGQGKTRTGRLWVYVRDDRNAGSVRHPTTVTGEALRRIGALYAIESEIRGSPAEERLAVRKARTVPLMQSLYEWLQGQKSDWRSEKPERYR